MAPMSPRVADEVMNVAERSRAEQHLIVGVLFDRQEPILSDAINAALDLD